MPRRFKYVVDIISKAGLLPPYAGAVTVVAGDEKEAKKNAIAKIVSEHRVFKRRISEQFWIINSVTEVADAHK